MTINTSKKLAGILVPAFSLRTSGDLGIGDTAAVMDAVDFCHHYCLGVLQLLPINETGGDNSPYNAISSMALDPALIHISASAPDKVPGLAEEDWQNLLAFDSKSAENTGPIDYPAVKNRKHFLLQKAFFRFQLERADNYTDLKNDFKSFQEDNKNWLPDYTLFRSIVARKEGNAQWTEWENGLQNIDSARQLLFQDEQIQKNCEFYAYVQWVAHRQWTEIKAYADERNVQLVGDIPFGVSRFSSDVWAHRHLFELEWSGGAPPERFFKADQFTALWGQNWGIPLYNWAEHERENYAWWRCRVNQVSKYFHGFRLDHVLGFFRIYAFPWTPEKNQTFTELSPEQAMEMTGGRLPQFMPRSDEEDQSAQLNCQEGMDRLKVIMESAGSTYVVAEDLGMVPPYVRPALKKLGIPGFSIPIFERDESDRSLLPVEKLPALSLGTYGTHDNDPIVTYYEGLVKWWHGEDGDAGWLEIQRLMHFLKLDETNPPLTVTNDLLFAFFRALLSSPCWLTVLMITDLLGTKQRFNLPGTSSNSNWSERLEKSLSEYTKDARYADKFNFLRQLIIETKRQPDFISQKEPVKFSSEKITSAELPA
jgi:4-alpha-glucanotransferase